MHHSAFSSPEAITDQMHALTCTCLRAVNLSVPEEVDAKLTKELLDKYDLKAAGSLVSVMPYIHCGLPAYLV